MKPKMVEGKKAWPSHEPEDGGTNTSPQLPTNPSFKIEHGK
jgi:hypothetical protein